VQIIYNINYNFYNSSLLSFTFQYLGSHYGSQKIPGRSCADIFHQRCEEAKDGIYWLKFGINLILDKSLLGSEQMG
jgi:hypothetical protein